MRISKQEYARRRKALMNQMEANSIAVLPAAQVFIRNRDVEHNPNTITNTHSKSGLRRTRCLLTITAI
jgi:metallophosphoesterase superfamily enzyme